ncbi:MAG: hypothetical protein COV72_00430 [Candidatus Omnitrophica bacterium CG11_big_fil_rev_8_21_14_0_20_42_13]|uniref:GIY-YIG domain-containing protein n=1 Tax=Candidatus Ghiorseimicrobium undicola TaxID=1974746 RepID=A0A2H0M009_9BACT|nr:MAG: hypothetical protein COV72_00430 [Candidatus Omnitrophica bacterium CG11_big_fil_rev_8_21_14_0_20_42_13]
MAAYTYVLKSLKDQRLYVGATRLEVSQRLQRHNAGDITSTKNRRPLILLHYETFNDYSGARKRELYLKTGSGREHLLRILENRAGTQAAKGDRL